MIQKKFDKIKEDVKHNYGSMRGDIAIIKHNDLDEGADEDLQRSEITTTIQRLKSKGSNLYEGQARDTFSHTNQIKIREGSAYSRGDIRERDDGSPPRRSSLSIGRNSREDSQRFVDESNVNTKLFNMKGQSLSTNLLYKNPLEYYKRLAEQYRTRFIKLEQEHIFMLQNQKIDARASQKEME